MSKYLIKEGFKELGPFGVEELKRLKITKFTLVKEEGSDEWKIAESIPELKILFTKSGGFKWFWMLLLLVVVLILIFANLPRHINSGNSSNYSNQTVEEEIVIPPPPKVVFDISHHQKKVLKELFKSCNLSGDKQQLVNSCNYSNKVVRNLAVSLAGKSAGEYNLGQVCDIFDYCFNNWKYVNDSKENGVVEYASNTIENGLNGDCDDFAVLVCSMVLSIGGEARINYAYNDDTGHAFTEVNIGKMEVEDYLVKRYAKVYKGDGIFMRSDNQGNRWLNLDWFAKHPGGGYFEYKTGTTFYLIQEYCEDF